MKKINSIGYGYAVLKMIGIFLFLIPLGLLILNCFLSLYIVKLCITISITISGIIALFLFGLLTMEFRQDKKIDQFYNDRKKTKMLLHDKYYECQSCGNMNLKAEDKFCNVCGVNFENKRGYLYGKY